MSSAKIGTAVNATAFRGRALQGGELPQCAELGSVRLFAVAGLPGVDFSGNLRFQSSVGIVFIFLLKSSRGLVVAVTVRWTIRRSAMTEEHRAKGTEQRNAHLCSVGTRRFNSSSQFSTTLICMGASSGVPTNLSIKNRWPSGETA